MYPTVLSLAGAIRRGEVVLSSVSKGDLPKEMRNKTAAQRQGMLDAVPDGCWNCRFRRNNECRFNPPEVREVYDTDRNVPVGERRRRVCFQPPTPDDYWCGQHKKKA